MKYQCLCFLLGEHVIEQRLTEEVQGSTYMCNAIFIGSRERIKCPINSP